MRFFVAGERVRQNSAADVAPDFSARQAACAAALITRQTICAFSRAQYPTARMRVMKRNHRSRGGFGGFSGFSDLFGLFSFFHLLDFFGFPDFFDLLSFFHLLDFFGFSGFSGSGVCCSGGEAGSFGADD